MAGSALRGVDALISQRRPVLRIATYAVLCLMAMLNMALLSSSWANTRFMRESGAFTGLFVVTTSAVTMVVSGVLATAVALCRRAQLRDTAAPRICERLTADRAERAACCLMATWWLAMALCVSNTAYVFRGEIGRCANRRFPAGSLPRGVSADAAAAACIVFRGSLALSWMVWAVWAARVWRVFARSSMDFDSHAFPEHDSDAVGLETLKPVTAYLVNPETFSPRAPYAYQHAQGAQSLDSDCDSPGVTGGRFSLAARRAYLCTNKPPPLAEPGQPAPLPQGHATGGLASRGQNLAARYTVHLEPRAAQGAGGKDVVAEMAPIAPALAGSVVGTREPATHPATAAQDDCCRQPPVVGTATLATEPLDARASPAPLPGSLAARPIAPGPARY